VEASTTGPILIIEDDRDIAEVLRYSLEKEAFSTRVAFDGEEGLKASLDQTDPPSVILLDIFLPGMKVQKSVRDSRNHEHKTSQLLLYQQSPLIPAPLLGRRLLHSKTLYEV
jgi:DNA-binding response OmpR family regulator